jgi:hypothetical protein
LLPVLLVILLQFSAVQQRVKDMATGYLTRKTGMEISIDNIQMALPFYYRIAGLTIRDHHGIVMVRSARASIRITSFGLRSHQIRINQLRLKNADVYQRLYTGEKTDNLSLFFQKLSSPQKDKKDSLSQNVIKLDRIILHGGTYHSYLSEKRAKSPLLDFNHLAMNQIYADISNIVMEGDNTSFKINRLSFSETGGFRLRNLTALTEISPTSIRLRNLIIETLHSSLALDLSFHYLSFDDFADVENKVLIKSNFGVSSLSTHDLGFFVREFWQTNNQIQLKGSLKGFISDFSTKGLQFSTGATSFDGDIAVEGLPETDNTLISLDIKHLEVDPVDIAAWTIWSDGQLRHIPVPDELRELGPVSVDGKFNGYLHDFYIRANFSGGFGQVHSDMQMTEKGGLYYADGTIGIAEIDAGKYLNYIDLGLVSLDAALNGTASSKSWDFKIDAVIHSLDFREYTYSNIDINGDVKDRQFKGTVNIEDQNISLDFNGDLDFNQDIPNYSFVADIRKANLSRLGIVTDSLKGFLSARISMDMRGDHPDNLTGLVKVDFAEFNTPGSNYSLKSLELNALASPENKRKLIVLRSDYLDGDIYGNFSYARVPDALYQFLQPIIPGLLKELFPGKNETVAFQDTNEVFFDFHLKKTGQLTRLLFSFPVDAEEIRLEGSYQQGKEKLRLTAGSDKVMMGEQSLENWYFNLYNTGKGLVVESGASSAGISDTIALYGVSWEGTIQSDRFDNQLTWKINQESFDPEGDIHSIFEIKSLNDLNLRFIKGNILIRDSLWHIQDGSNIAIRGKTLDINNFVFFNNEQSIRIDGESAEKSDHSITCTFHDIDLSWIDFLTVPSDVNLDGMINGTLNLRNVFNDVKVLSDLQVNDFTMNGEYLGNMKIISMWNDELQGMKISSDFIYQGNTGVKKTAEISGYLFPFRKGKDNFDLAVDFDNFRLNILSTLLSDITTDVRGFASGRLYLKGTFLQPEVTGKLKATVRNMYIDYLNTWYSFTDTIVFTKDAIIFPQVQLSDNNRGNSREPYSAELKGSIGHKGFTDFHINLNIKAENFTFLNTHGEQDPYYYGKAVASGNISIAGPDDDLLITIQAKTDRGTLLEIPITSSSEVSKSSFINFTDRRQVSDDIEYHAQKKRKENILRMNMNISVTPEATVKLIFDPLIGDQIEASGSGDLQMGIDSKGDFDLRGQYYISNGDYTFNLENIISKKFSIKNGSSIGWTGDPYDANLEIEAIYNTKANLSPLNLGDSTLGSQSVNCVIYMTEKLSNPNIRFGIEFPDMTSFDAEKYQAVVKPNLNYQFLSLLAISRFVNTQSEKFLDAGSSANLAGVNATELLANQLSLWLSSISDEVDVDFAYHPGTGLSQEQVEAALKTQMLNDRLTIESKVGIGGKTYAGSSAKTGNMVGEINAEYQIDQEGKFKVKAYNRHNGYNILYEGAPYTQGIGVFYRKEFESLKDIFRKQKREPL